MTWEMVWTVSHVFVFVWMPAVIFNVFVILPICVRMTSDEEVNGMLPGALCAAPMMMLIGVVVITAIALTKSVDLPKLIITRIFDSKLVTCSAELASRLELNLVNVVRKIGHD